MKKDKKKVILCFFSVSLPLTKTTKMELKEIQNLIKFVSSQKVDEVEIEKKDFKIVIKKNQAPAVPTAQMVHIPANTAAPIQGNPAPATSAAPAAVDPPAEDAVDANLFVIKSPMVGTFYRSTNPESPSFVNVGHEVSNGKVVCIVEAMKLFNEIESEVSGKIVKVLVDNATPVEYDQPLFLVEPS